MLYNTGNQGNHSLKGIRQSIYTVLPKFNKRILQDYVQVVRLQVSPLVSAKKETQNNYHPQTKLRKGNVFTSVCQELCPKGGVSAAVHAGIHTPQADTPLDRHPLAYTPLGRHPNSSGWYTSYWNAFLL